MTKIIGGIAGALLLAGLIIGFIPTQADGAHCGSAYHPASDIYVGTLNGIDAMHQCASTRSLIRIPAITLTALGLVGIVAAAVIGGAQRQRAD